MRERVPIGNLTYFVICIKAKQRRTRLMQTYDQLIEVAAMCARQARLSTSKDVALHLWRMAKEHQERAAKLGGGKLSDIGDPPRWISQ